MKYQRFVSLSAALSFILVFISSGVLYFIPDRQVTSWTDWRFLGLDKQQWDNLHINIGIFFLVMIVWHIYFNWKPIKNYLKVKKKWKVFTREFNFALLWVLLFTAGTVTMTLPFSALVNIGNGIKAINSLDDGDPPFGYAEYATLEDFCLIEGIDLQSALKKLEKRGIRIDSARSTLKKIASANGISPKEIYKTIKPEGMRLRLPSTIPVGIAHKTILRLSQEYRIDLQRFIEHLKSYGIEATPEITFKKLAKKNSLHPAELYSMLLASQAKAQP